MATRREGVTIEEPRLQPATATVGSQPAAAAPDGDGHRPKAVLDARGMCTSSSSAVCVTWHPVPVRNLCFG